MRSPQRCLQQIRVTALLCVCSAPDLVAEVAADLPFASTVQAVANGILRNMTKNGAVAFNSLHLRVEADAKDWMDNMGGSKVTYLSGL